MFNSIFNNFLSGKSYLLMKKHSCSEMTPPLNQKYLMKVDRSKTKTIKFKNGFPPKIIQPRTSFEDFSRTTPHQRFQLVMAFVYLSLVNDFSVFPRFLVLGNIRIPYPLIISTANIWANFFCQRRCTSHLVHTELHKFFDNSCLFQPPNLFFV